MRWKTMLRDLPGRTAAGAFILNSGLSKRSADAETAEHLHGMASGTYPFVKNLDAQTFTRLVSAGEITLGTVLLLPVVPTAVAGAGLAAFAGGLFGLYLRTPGMRQEGSLRPTPDGIALAKDTWLLGMGLGFVLDTVAGDRK
ncbi:MAG: hypothetical protein GEV07_04190 [Streptosporangiales bacterium]|nr:hypothetical protein [Streptosporangiales bacterium]